MATKKERKHAVGVSLATHLNAVDEILDTLGADNLGNGLKKVKSLHAKLEEKQAQIDAVCDLVGTNHIGNALSKITTLMKKEVTIAERFNLDITFLDEQGKTWLFKAEGKTPEERFKAYTRGEASARAMTRQAYETALQRVVSYCEAEKMKEGAIRKEVLDIHTRMADDYNQLNQEAFWYEYCGQYTVSTGETAEPVPLVTWLDVCGEYFPERLIEDLRVRGDDLGVISRALHEAWDGEVINDMKGVAFRVIKTAIETAVWGSQGADMRTDAVLHNVLMNNGEPLDESTSLDSIVQLIEG